MTEPRLPFDAPSDPSAEPSAARDNAARARAVDPRVNVALEASAGTGKTRVLVDRYVNLLRAGVDPTNILAITFTRKAAAEMRERIMATLRAAGEGGELPASRWRELRDRTADIAVSTIDAFCLSLLREFPLEADLDPAFSVADDTELPRLVREALDRALRTCRAVAREDDTVGLAFAQLGERRVRGGLSVLLSRRVVAPDVLSKYLERSGAAGLQVAAVGARAARGLLAVFDSMRGGFDRFLDTGPLDPGFLLLARSLRQVRAVEQGRAPDPAAVQAAFTRAREHFLTRAGEARIRLPYPKSAFASEADWRTHRDLVVGHAEAVLRASAEFRRELNVLVSAGIWRMFRIAETEYRHTLDTHAVLDFSDLLLRALDLLRRMEEFSRSRYRLESRYHHVLVDEFQDTSRAQWELISLLIQSWGEGAGLAHTGPLQPSIFIVGDRKQSIYGFRDADVSVLREAARYLDGLRPDGDVRRTIVRSFRATAPLLAFVNDVCQDMDKISARKDAFEYGEADRFPLDAAPTEAADAPLGMVAAETPEACAEMTAAEIERLLVAGALVRDRDTGLARAIRPGDVGILFRTRESHREFEAELERRHIRTYVYKGLGFFDADEIKDVLALVWYLAEPASDLRAAALLRSRVFGVSDEGLRLLSPHLSRALLGAPLPATACLSDGDARIVRDAREATTRWLGRVDRMPPAELVDLILTESAYAYELRGPRFAQARENLKKVRSLMRRVQNHGYATIGRLAAHLDRLSVGDEANAAIDALDAVSLMTVHASKGLEFPVVFLVNLSRGSGARRDPVRIAADASVDDASVAIGDFQSEADDNHPVREREETKRLVYVALTRARDRLYLGSVLKEGRVQPGRGSLAEVLPPSLLAQLAVRTDVVEWRPASGRPHRFRVCPAAGPVGFAAPVDAYGIRATDVPLEADRTDDFAPLTDVEPFPSTVVGTIATVDVQAAEQGGGLSRVSGPSSRLVGTLVHRLLQRVGFGAADGAQAIGETVEQLIRPEEMSAAAEEYPLTELVGEVVEAFCALRGRAEVHALYAAGERMHEVPFTMRLRGEVVRGTIDCLVRDEAGRVTVLEFKTGRPRDEHQVQLDLYRQAAERLFPGARVEALLVYTGGG